MKFLLLCILPALLSCTRKQPSTAVLFAGDLMLDRGVRQIIDKKGLPFLFEKIDPILRHHDLVISNFEGTACDSGLPGTDKKFRFRASYEWLQGLKRSGITHVSLANNHSLDFGVRGALQTDSALNAQQIHTLGFARHYNSACVPTVIENNNNTIAIFAATFLRTPDEAPICHANATALSETISAYRSGHRSDFIVAELHWGVEMRQIPEAGQIKAARQLIDAGADLIIGHHPHVVQPVERYHNRYIFYSLGNFVFDNHTPPASQGLLASVALTNNKVIALQLIPFDLIMCSPVPMANDAATGFIENLQKLSPSVKFEKKGLVWVIVN